MKNAHHVSDFSPLLNNNMRCFEIPMYDRVRVWFLPLNNSMRCFEIIDFTWCVKIRKKLNNNINL